MKFERVTLAAPAGELAGLADFYHGVLGLERTDSAINVGETTLEFVRADDRPFYHFALLVPGDRFDAVLDWARERVALLLDRETGDARFDFSNWDASACYFHDPVGNIVELIAHRMVARNARSGPFSPSEVVGLSELGLVGETRYLADRLERALGLVLWDGTIEEPGTLAFVGDRGRTLILAPPGRGWLPTSRPAEVHPLTVELADVNGHVAIGSYVLRGSI